MKTQIGKYVFTQLEDVEWDNHRYSKAWHRVHGGVRIVSNRRVTIEKIDKRTKNGKKLLATVPFSGWSSNVLLRAIIESGVFTPPASSAPLSIRLNKFYDAKKVRSIGSVDIFERTLLSERVDYCAVFNRVTYHAKTARLAVAGVHRKIKARTKKLNEPVSYQLCKKLGFCDAGISDFVDTFGLDISGTYSPETIERLVRAAPDKAAPFEDELRIIAKTLNYPISI